MPNRTDDVYYQMDEMGYNGENQNAFFNMLHENGGEAFRDFREQYEIGQEIDRLDNLPDNIFTQNELNELQNQRDELQERYDQTVDNLDEQFNNYMIDHETNFDAGVDINDNAFEGMNFDLGSAFVGEKTIKFKETNEYVIFESPYCVFNMYKYIAENYEEELITPIIPPKKFTLNSINLNKYFKLSKRVGKSHNGDFSYKNSIKKNKNEKQTYPYIFMAYQGNKLGHCVLIKTKSENYEFKIEYEEKINILTNENEDESQYKMKNKPYRNKKESIIIFDIESMNQGIHVPILIGGYELNFKQFREYKKTNNLNAIESEYKQFFTLQEFLNWVETKESNQVFAHNNGCYDIFMFFRAKDIDVTFLDDIFVCGSFRSVRMRLNQSKKEIDMKDSFAFFNQALYKFNKSTKNILYNKKEFDCNDVKEEDKNDPEFQKYLMYDVLSLAESICTFEEWLNELHLSVTTSMGAPGLSMKFYQNKFSFEDLYCPKSNNGRKFQKSAVYGGRVLHHYKELRDNVDEFGLPTLIGYENNKPIYEKEELICFDCNSLYPTALLYDYPMGEYRICKKEQLTKEFITGEKLGIYEVELDGLNCKYPFVPYKKSSKSITIYPSNKFRGVYTSVDIQNALSGGYKILNIYQGIYWDKKRALFKDCMEFLYNERKKLKADKNPAEQIYKLLMNSFYGKFLESVMKTTTYKNPGYKCLNTKLGNGQIRYRIDHFSKVERPPYIGAFVLSYSKSVMNKLFEKIPISEIYYGDTDCYYVPKKYANVFKQTSELGDFKNDYGENKVINGALFLDYKRYFLEFNNGTYASKFNGLQTKKKCKIIDEDCGDEKIKGCSIREPNQKGYSQEIRDVLKKIAKEKTEKEIIKNKIIEIEKEDYYKKNYKIIYKGLIKNNQFFDLFRCNNINCLEQYIREKIFYTELNEAKDGNCISTNQIRWIRNLEIGIQVNMREIQFLVNADKRRKFINSFKSQPNDFDEDKPERNIHYEINEFIFEQTKFENFSIERKKVNNEYRPTLNLKKPFYYTKNISFKLELTNISSIEKDFIRIDKINNKTQIGILGKNGISKNITNDILFDDTNEIIENLKEIIENEINSENEDEEIEDEIEEIQLTAKEKKKIETEKRKIEKAKKEIEKIEKLNLRYIFAIKHPKPNITEEEIRKYLKNILNEKEIKLILSN